MKRFLFFLLVMCAVTTWARAAQPAANHPLLLEPARVWTAGEPVHSGWVVLIEGNQIKAVGPKSSVMAPSDAEHIALPGMTVFPSAGNFLLVRVPDAAVAFETLLTSRVLIKNVGKMHPLLTNCVRLTVGTAEENAHVVAALKKLAPN